MNSLTLSGLHKEPDIYQKNSNHDDLGTSGLNEPCTHT